LNDLYFKKEINEIRLRNNSSNWGSCSSNKNISISSRLLLAPPFVLDYIIIHELAHLIHHNHSKAYWQLVERIMPDYMLAEDWLKKHGTSCQW
jgi:predicted metal-dependent hydrolase